MERWRQRYTWYSAFVLIILLCMTTAVREVHAGGLPLSAHIPAEQALIMFTKGREEIITSFQIQGNTPAAAVIFPIPGRAEIELLEQSSLFAYLHEVTQPKILTEERLVWYDQEDDLLTTALPSSASVEEHLISGYDVTQITGEYDKLQHWIEQKGYSLPPTAIPILHTYVEEGWTFVMIEIAADQRLEVTLKPLRIAFSSTEVIYPMRLGALSGQPADVLLYVLTDQRVEIAGMETVYAGPTAQLDRVPPNGLKELLAAPFLTKLRYTGVGDEAITSDFIARPAANNQPFRLEEMRTTYVNGWQRLAGPIVGLILVMLASSLALGFAFSLRRQFDRIGGPDPDRDED